MGKLRQHVGGPKRRLCGRHSITHRRATYIHICKYLCVQDFRVTVGAQSENAVEMKNR